MTTTSTAKPSQVELLNDATRGVSKLLNNDLPGAQEILKSHADSPFHLIGLGLSSFLSAALGQEDSELTGALAILVRAESLASAAQTSNKRSKSDGPAVFPAGTEYQTLVADAVVCQALVHVLTSSYVEFMKAIYKINRAYKMFGNIYKIVFPVPVAESDSLATIFTTLNATYAANLRKATLNPSEKPVSSFLGWGSSKKRSDLSNLRPSSSTTALPSIEKLNLSVPEPSGSVPSSRPASRSSSVEPEPGTRAKTSTLISEDGKPVPTPLWEGDGLSTLVISGASFGTGLFALIFSILPPKLRKLISWIGFSNSNRAVALKLLTVASGGDDVHAYFASLALLTFYGVVLLMSGWQAEEAFLLQQCTAVLDPIYAKFPSGTLWVLNRAKLCRYKNETSESIRIMEESLEKGSDFREADSLLVFELAWTLLSDAQWLKAADQFLAMRKLNNWSHATYVFISAGALLELSAAEQSAEIAGRIETLLDELPSLFGLKRLLGEPPSTETFIIRKLATYKAKHSRWVLSGRLSAESHYREVIRISPASELGLFWNTPGRAPHASLRSQIERLEAFTPPPRFSPTTSISIPSIPSTLSLRSSHLHFDLDSIDEIATRDLLLGAMYRVLGDLTTARKFLQEAVSAQVTEETWVAPFATMELAVLECFHLDKEAAKDGASPKSVWKAESKTVVKHIDAVFSFGEYDLKSRLDSRAQMLRDQVLEKKAKLGI